MVKVVIIICAWLFNVSSKKGRTRITSSVLIVSLHFTKCISSIQLELFSSVMFCSVLQNNQKISWREKISYKIEKSFVRKKKEKFQDAIWFFFHCQKLRFALKLCPDSYTAIFISVYSLSAIYWLCRKVF